ncbi:MAG: hypothetical protein AAF822_14055 [Pseudomonadota bacterium]
MKRRLVTAIAALVCACSTVAAEESCYPILTDVSYCTDGLLLGHVDPGSDQDVGGPMPHIRAWFSNETKPFTATMILSIPVSISGEGTVDHGTLMSLVMQNSDADGWREARFVNAKAGPAQLGIWPGVVGQFTGVSASGLLRTNYVLNAVLIDTRILALMTIDDQSDLTERLWAQHDKTLSGLRVAQ